MTEAVIGLVVAITILVPGLVIRRFQQIFLTLPDPKHEKEALLLIAIYGLANLAFTWPILLLLGIDPLTPLLLATSVSEIANSFRATSVIVWFVQLFLAPVFLAIARCYLEREGTITRFLSKLGLTPSRATMFAWDKAFAMYRDYDVLVTVTLKGDGTVLYGRFGVDAIAGIKGTDCDLFLDEVYIPAEDGSLVLDETSQGILIPASEIRYLVFSELPDEDEDEVPTED